MTYPHNAHFNRAKRGKKLNWNRRITFTLLMDLCCSEYDQKYWLIMRKKSLLKIKELKQQKAQPKCFYMSLANCVHIYRTCTHQTSWLKQSQLFNKCWRKQHRKIWRKRCNWAGKEFDFSNKAFLGKMKCESVLHEPVAEFTWMNFAW